MFLGSSDGSRLNLWYGRPIAVFLDTLSQFLVSQDIVTFKCDVMHLEDLHHSIAEPALGRGLLPLHEDNHFGVVDQLVNLIVNWI